MYAVYHRLKQAQPGIDDRDALRLALQGVGCVWVWVWAGGWVWVGG